MNKILPVPVPSRTANVGVVPPALQTRPAVAVPPWLEVSAPFMPEPGPDAPHPSELIQPLPPVQAQAGFQLLA
jgi:hypothetical protein